MYGFDYHDYAALPWMEEITFHARIYSYGEKYLIPGLKCRALEKCKESITSLFDEIDPGCFEGFPAAITEIYTSTPDTDRGLRDLIASTCSENLPELQKMSEFLNTLTIPGFAGRHWDARGSAAYELMCGSRMWQWH
jgi:hypothetical protein